MYVYGGVDFDIQVAEEFVAKIKDTSTKDSEESTDLTRLEMAFLILVVLVVDMPLSVIGDTLTLGMTIPASKIPLDESVISARNFRSQNRNKSNPFDQTKSVVTDRKSRWSMAKNLR